MVAFIRFIKRFSLFQILMSVISYMDCVINSALIQLGVTLAHVLMDIYCQMNITDAKQKVM